MNLIDIDNFIADNANKSKSEFASKLITSSLPILGVTTPKLRGFAKKIVKDRDLAIQFIEQVDSKSYDEEMLKGFVIGELRGSINIIINYIDSFVSRIDNWGVCDSFCTSLKWIVKQDSNAIWDIIERDINSKDEFRARWCIVMIIAHFLDSKNIIHSLNTIDKVLHRKEYYIEMGTAWALATAVAKCRNEAIDYITTKNLPLSLLRKTVSKCRDSYRVTDNDKHLLKESLKEQIL